MTTITNQTSTDQTEIEMLQCLMGGQREFSKLYDRYSAAVYSLILKWIKDTETAQNLLQDVFMKAWRSRERYNAEKGRLFTWFYHIARHICIDYMRSKAYKKMRASVMSDDVPLLIPEGFVTMNKNPDAIGLRNLVRSLVKEEQEIIEMMYFKGYTQREIAQITETPLGTIKTRMSRAIRNMRQFFKDDWEEASQYISLN